MTPSICEVIYFCEIIAGPRNDICPGIVDGSTVSTFNETNGSFTFSSSDYLNYPAGIYIIAVRMATADRAFQSNPVFFNLLLVNPCETTTLELIQ